MQTALRVQKEAALKTILAALWNLSAHSDENKVRILRSVRNLRGNSDYNFVRDVIVGGYMQP
jgi:hypothetical protein